MHSGPQRDLEILEFELALEAEPEVRLGLGPDHPPDLPAHREQKRKRR
jgi:hypothetical protein